MRIENHYVKMLSHTPNPEQLIEAAGRLCYKSEPKPEENSHVPFIRMLLDPSKKHESVLEHASATFLIGTDRGITHELVRHRIASYSQTSTRYVNYSKDKFGNEIAVVCPVDIKPLTSEFWLWKAACEHAEQIYMGLLEKGMKPQVARSVLPTCTFSEITMTLNFRAWRNFLGLRTSAAAHPDMRVVAEMIRQELVKLAPTVFADFADELGGS